MPIKASPVTPVKKELKRSDPSGDTWVLVKPASTREDLLRGELLKTQEVSWDDEGRIATRVVVNQYQLQLEEVWLTFGGGHVVLEKEEGEDETLFPNGEKTTRPDFFADIMKIPPSARNEWVGLVREVNPAWLYPF